LPAAGATQATEPIALTLAASYELNQEPIVIL